jgi:hypothetical protein
VLCSADKNLSAAFISAFVLCLIVMIALIHFLMCMVANLTRLRQRRNISKGKDYEAVDQYGGANSFIMNVIVSNGKKTGSG